MGIGESFWWQDALPHQPAWIRKETLESGNLFHVKNHPESAREAKLKQFQANSKFVQIGATFLLPTADYSFANQFEDNVHED